MTSTSRFTKKSTNGFRSSLTSLEGQLLSNRLSEFNFVRDIFFPGSCSYLLHPEDYLLRFWMWFLLFCSWETYVFFSTDVSPSLLNFKLQFLRKKSDILSISLPTDSCRSNTNFPFSKHNFNHLLEENLNMDFYASSIVRHINSTALNYWKYCWQSTRFICSWAASPYREIHCLN